MSRAQDRKVAAPLDLAVFDTWEPSVEQLMALRESRIDRRFRDGEHRSSDGSALLWAELPLPERDQVTADESLGVVYRL
jgi:hypothetical protein